ncbi:glycerophosphodiester phosphodiesterase family protein [Sphingosinicella terrae]|uniref:glycerophosphodiester phosphodiesterase family protein n=1 Tax=Sphingosinicella terrae TaxID=2172047 RepID=UPI000E0CEEAC|nr:glycerophosphodiester phosphodiesterase family protein [Sphingosinicella terrae]
MRVRSVALALVAAAAVGLSLVNASWIAPAPEGRLTLVAHRGIAQPLERPHAPGCSARRVADFGHNYIENTLFSMQGAIAHGARGFLLDVRTSADGHAVIFRDETLECRTDGVGRVRDRILPYLKTLDVGFGYSSDGRTFPLRGRGVGAMPAAAELIRAFPRETLIFTLGEPADAASIVAAFRAAGVAIGAQHGFAGHPAALERLRQLTPGGWVLDRAASQACLSDYRRSGWTSLVPESCRGATLLLPRRGGLTLWGWPYRFLDRMAGVDARLLIAGDSRRALVGLDRPEQLGEVPRDYRGLLLVEDMWNVGRALD